jgi:UDP-4-amino-4,6-dideoxy-N-acetyl-beta-L-altrosamine transaminase
MKAIPYGRQHITDEDIQDVIAVLKGEYLTQGPKIGEFESAFSQYIGSKYAIAVANGTAALHLCALAMDIQKGDKVITTPITFAASANCVRYCGGDVVFADIDAETYLLDIRKVKQLIENNPAGSYRGIIPVDFAGKAVDLEAYRRLADEFNLWLIEDACHAPGGFFTDASGNAQKCGNGQFAELAIFSFHPVKHIAAGEGGMITTNNKELYEKLLMLRTHGITRNPSQYQNTAAFATSGQHENEYPGWYMEMQELGFNYRLTDFQAALGLSQLKRAGHGLERRIQIAKKYDEAFAAHPKIKSQLNELQPGVSGHAYHLYIIQVPDRLGLYNYLRQQNIFAQVHYIPTHLMPYYRRLGWKENHMPIAEAFYRKCLSLPMYPTLSDKEQEFVITQIKKYCDG